MGLDNGIILRVPETKELPNFGNPLNNKFHEVEICYWRKCWGIREAILGVLDPDGLKKDEYEFNIDAEDIPSIIRVLKPFFSKEFWDANARSIWEFDEMFENLIDAVLNLEKLKSYLEENKDSTAYFYDSY